MKFKVEWTHDQKKFEIHEFNTIEELLNFCETMGNPLIIESGKNNEDGMPSVEIYDDYRE